MQRKFGRAAADRVAAAVRELESRSAAELIVEIRGWSGSYAHADARFAATLAFATLVVLVFMPLVVPPVAVVIVPLPSYFLGLLIARRSAFVRRLFTTGAERMNAVRTHAAARFHERGVGATSGETGLLLYASLLERRLELIADRGVLRSVAAHEWNALVADVHRRRDRIDVETILEAIAALAAVLGRHLPPRAGDVDELPNAIEVRLA